MSSERHSELHQWYKLGLIVLLSALSVQSRAYELTGTFERIKSNFNWVTSDHSMLVMVFSVDDSHNSRTLVSNLGDHDVSLIYEKTQGVRRLRFTFVYSDKTISYPLLEPITQRGDSEDYLVYLYLQEDWMWIETVRPDRALSRVYTNPVFFGVGRTGMNDAIKKHDSMATYIYYSPGAVPITQKITQEYSETVQPVFIDFRHAALATMTAITNIMM